MQSLISKSLSRGIIACMTKLSNAKYETISSCIYMKCSECSADIEFYACELKIDYFKVSPIINIRIVSVKLLLLHADFYSLIRYYVLTNFYKVRTGGGSFSLTWMII